MSRNKWLAAIVIVGILAIAFFGSGNSHKSTILPEQSIVTAEVSPEIDTTQTLVTKEQQQEETQSQVTREAPESRKESQVKEEPQFKEEALKPEAGETVKSGKASAADSAAITKQPISKPPSSATTNKSDQAAETTSVSATSKAAEQVSQPTKSQVPAEGSSALAVKPDKNSSASNAKKDQYLTDPVPSGKPEPVEWQNAKVDKKKKLTATLSVTCNTIFNNMDAFNKDKLEVLPEGGVIYKAQKVTFFEGESVFDVLLREMRANKIHMEFSMTPIYNSNYIEGINNIYEFDCGELSGWMFKVNGWFPNYGSSRYLLKDGDIIEWVYTCDLGRDVGADQAGAGGKG